MHDVKLELMGLLQPASDILVGFWHDPLCHICIYKYICTKIATKTDLSLDRAFPQYQQGRVDFNSADTLLFMEARIS